MNHWPLTILHSFAALSKLFIPIILVRVFPMAEIGTYKLFYLYLYLVPELFVAGGITNGLGHWVGEKEKDGLIASATWLVMISSLLAPLVMLGFIVSGVSLFDEPLLNAALLLNILLLLPRLYCEELLIVLGHVWISAKYRLWGELCRATALVGTAVLTGDLALALLVSAGFSLLELSLYGYFLLQNEGFKFSQVSRKNLARILAYALPLTGAGVAVILFERFDQFLLSELLPRDQFALYSMGCLAVPPLLILEQSITRLLIPALSHARDGMKWQPEAHDIYRRSIAQLAFWLIPSALFLSFFSEPIVVLLFTEQYIVSAFFLKLFAVIYIALVLPYDVVPRSLGQSWWIFRTYIGSGALTVGLVSCFAYFHGAPGALLGLIVSQIIVRSYGTWYAAYSFQVSLRAMLPLFELTKIIASSLVGLALSALLLTIDLAPLISVFGGMALFTFGFLVSWVLYPFRKRAAFTQPCRVLQITQFLIAGGLEKVVVDLAVRMQRSPEWRSYVVSYDAREKSLKSDLYNHLQSEGITTTLFQKRSGFCIKTIGRLVELLSRERIEIIHTHDLGGLIYGVFAKICSVDSLILIHTQHSFVHLTRNSRYGWYERIFTHFADVVVPVSESLEETYWKLGVPASKMMVVPNGVAFNKDVAPPSRGRMSRAKEVILRDHGLDDQQCAVLHGAPIWLVYVARIHPGKGQDEAIAIWQKLSPEVRDRAALIFVGPASYEEELLRILELTAKGVDSDRIIFAGHSASPAVWYEAATVSMSSSAFEGHPLVPIEALGNGSAFLASDIAGHRFLAGKATLYSTGEAAVGARALEAMIRSAEQYPNEWNERLRGLQKEMRKRYSLEFTVREYQHLYRRVSGRNIHYTESSSVQLSELREVPS